MRPLFKSKTVDTVYVFTSPMPSLYTNIGATSFCRLYTRDNTSADSWCEKIMSLIAMFEIAMYPSNTSFTTIHDNERQANPRCLLVVNRSCKIGC